MPEEEGAACKGGFLKRRSKLDKKRIGKGKRKSKRYENGKTTLDVIWMGRKGYLRLWKKGRAQTEGSAMAKKLVDFDGSVCRGAK